jgi:hypothetical protein
MHLKAIGLAAVTALVLSIPALAHHSHANYEQS